MNELFFVRIFAYTFLPLLPAGGHLLLGRPARTPARRIELFMLYLFAISVGANGLGGAFGYLFLSDLVAEGVGWEAGILMRNHAASQSAVTTGQTRG